MRVPVKIIPSFSCFLFFVTFVQGQAVTCELKSTTFRVKSIKPEGQTIFRAGERVEITCTEKGWFRTKETKQIFTCQDDGEWDGYPVCEEIKCEVPYNQHVHFPTYYFSRDKSLGAEIRYSCDDGYVNNNNAEKATCTRDGWTPKPLCVETTCAVPEIPNAEIIGRKELKYRINSRIRYRCHPGFEPQQLQQTTCDSQGQWTNVRQCTKLCAAPVIPNAEIEGRLEQYYRTGSKIKYRCVSGFEPQEFQQITCDSQGQWMGMQNCTELCRALSVENGFSISSKKDEIFYSCNAGYKPFRGNWWGSVTCNKGSWPDEPLCIPEKECGALQSVQNGKLNHNTHNNRTAELKCDPGFTPNTSSINCISGTWEPATCEKIMCNSPNIPNAEIVSGQRQNYKISSRIQYKCLSGFEPEEPLEITCDSPGEWTGIRQCTVTDGTCQEQELKNVKIIYGHPGTTLPYKSGHALVFQCTDDNMILYGHRAIECQLDGRWSYPYPQCGGTVHCSHPTKNLQFVRVSDEKTVYSSSEILRYSCNEPYNETAGGVLMCQDGKWNGTFHCKSKTCPPPPYVEHGDFSIIRSTDNKVITAVSYMCQSYYLLNKQQESYKCVDGIWETPPKCLRPCVIDDIVEKYNLKPPPNKVHLMHGNKYKLDCRDGWKAGSGMKAHVDVTCSDGNLQIQQSCDTQKS